LKKKRQNKGKICQIIRSNGIKKCQFQSKDKTRAEGGEEEVAIEKLEKRH